MSAGSFVRNAGINKHLWTVECLPSQPHLFSLQFCLLRGGLAIETVPPIQR